MTLKKNKKITVQKVQKVFNEYIRKRDAKNGFIECISCPKIVAVNNAHASHFYSAGHYHALRFNEDNVHSSCIQCNTFLHGNLIQYRQGLLKRIGPERLERLEILAAASKRSVTKYSQFELEYIYKEYKQKIKEIKANI